jgi:hypothetical protein
LILLSLWYDMINTKRLLQPATGTVQFWEPMVPYEFVSGNVSRFYEESVSYVSQTIDELPSYWSMGYDPASNFTTLTLKGRSKNCHSA